MGDNNQIIEKMKQQTKIEILNAISRLPSYIKVTVYDESNNRLSVTCSYDKAIRYGDIASASITFESTVEAAKETGPCLSEDERRISWKEIAYFSVDNKQIGETSKVFMDDPWDKMIKNVHNYYSSAEIGCRGWKIHFVQFKTNQTMTLSEMYKMIEIPGVKQIKRFNCSRALLALVDIQELVDVYHKKIRKIQESFPSENSTKEIRILLTENIGRLLEQKSSLTSTVSSLSKNEQQLKKDKKVLIVSIIKLKKIKRELDKEILQKKREVGYQNEPPPRFFGVEQMVLEEGPSEVKKSFSS